MRYAHYALLGGPWMMGMGLLVIILVIYLIYRNNNSSNYHMRNSEPHNGAYNEALDVLKMKFVNGEITEEDYLRKRNLLMK